jgi:hypothetical protein
MGAPDSPMRHRIGIVLCPVRRHVTQPFEFGAETTVGALSLEAPDSPVPHQTVWCPSDFTALTSTWNCCSLWLLSESTVGAGSRCSAGSPDSPVNYNGGCR